MKLSFISEMGTPMPREMEMKSKVAHVKTVSLSDSGPVLSTVFHSLCMYHTDIWKGLYTQKATQSTMITLSPWGKG